MTTRLTATGRSIKTEKQPRETGNSGFDSKREIEPDLISCLR
ncbi:hypothetical protein QUB63_32830 [Microcoleus sp. ARI1-B5]